MFGRLIARLIAKLITIFVFELLRFLFEIVNWIVITTAKCLFWTAKFLSIGVWRPVRYCLNLPFKWGERSQRRGVPPEKVHSHRLGFHEQVEVVRDDPKEVQAAAENLGSERRLALIDKGQARAVNNLRQQLLDIGKRNKLINAPVRKDRAKQITIEDELANEVFKILYLQGKSMTFQSAQDGVLTKIEDAADEPVFLPTEDVEPGTTTAARHSDSKLQTRLTPDRLQKKLLTLYRDAQTLEEEQGISVLFLALGFLRWYESDSSQTERFAPLILLPVDLERSSTRVRFRLIFRDQDLEPNLSLRALLSNDFGLTLPDFPEGDEWLPSGYFGRVQEAVESMARWHVQPNTIELGFFSFAKFLMWRDLDPESILDGTAGTGIFEDILVGGFESNSSIFAPYENLDTRFPDPRDLGHILDADTFQTQVISAAQEGWNLVVQGPPGTGKSQTIANIIAAVAKDGKKVLFVAEKRAALDVVHDRLERCGLGPLCLELHSHKAIRKHFYAELRQTLELGEPRVVNTERYEQVQRVRDELTAISALMHKVDEATGETPYLVIGKIADLAEGNCPRPDFRIPGADNWSRDAFEKRTRAVAALAALTVEHGSEHKHIWRGARKRLTQIDRQRLDERLRDILPRLDTARTVLREAARIVGIEDAGCAAAVEDVAGHLDALDAMPEAVPGLLDTEAVLEQPTMVLDLCENIAAAQVLRSNLVSDVVETALDLEWIEVRIAIAHRGRSLFRWLSRSYRRAVARLQSVQRLGLPKDLDGRLAMLDRLVEYRKRLRAIAKTADLGKEVLGRAWREVETDLGASLPAIRWIVSQSEKLGSAAAVKRQVGSVPPGLDLRALAEDLRKSSAAWIDTWNGIVQLVDLDTNATFGTESIEDIDLTELNSRLGSWISEAHSMEGWHRLIAASQRVTELGMDAIRERLADERLSPGHAQAVLEFVLAEVVWDRMRADEPRLESIDGVERSRKVEDFKDLDKQLQGPASQEVALRHFQSLPTGSAGQIGVVRGEIAKKTRHMRIRQLLDKAGEAVQAIKPVFLMSPLSVAQYLKTGGLQFDLLLIDEASQVRPADAMGAILRCRQVVVVGDQKQLPPTSFFDRQVEGDEEAADLEDLDEIQAAQVGDMESILSLCEARAMPGAMLRWHYRSRHPSLIQVSNLKFYDDSLICPPSPDREGRETGLSLVHVNGLYQRGRKRDNPREAETVAEQVLAHARSRPNETLGVVALSVAQRDTIRNKLEFMRAEYPELEAFCKEGKEEAFFVKNLENVQGDERDIIFISIGYGKDADGYMSQYFGPISNEGGERRLNVLFTRAKKRCCVFSSIRHSDIRIDAKRGVGPRVLKRYLKYAETGELDIPLPTGAEMDSPFEEAVAKALRSHGYRVEAQVGSSGFRIDLAVYDPEDEGRFLLAVECDGARYHSSSWARERDRLRQAVLEQKGWTFYRIWSTDWFYNRDGEVGKLLEAIERAQLNRHADTKPDSFTPRPTVERAEPVETSVLAGTPYIEADFTIPGSEYVKLWEAAEEDLMQCVLQIVETEGPVHIEEIARRLSRLWGYRRTGSRIQGVVKSAVNAAVEQNCIQYVDGAARRFLDRRDRTGKTAVRDRSAVRFSTLRKVEMLPPMEIREGILEAVERNIGINASDCAREVSRVLGFKSLSSDLRNRVSETATELAEEGCLVLSGEELRLP